MLNIESNLGIGTALWLKWTGGGAGTVDRGAAGRKSRRGIKQAERFARIRRAGGTPFRTVPSHFNHCLSFPQISRLKDAYRSHSPTKCMGSCFVCTLTMITVWVIYNPHYVVSRTHMTYYHIDSCCLTVCCAHCCSSKVTNSHLSSIMQHVT